MITAEYIQHMGSDLVVANAARVSFDKESEWDKEHFSGEDDVYLERLSARDAKLIAYLARHNHFTPFTHCMITMRETVPIFVARQRFKHVVGFSYNEVSRRYVDDEPEFYEPEVWRKRADHVKQGVAMSLWRWAIGPVRLWPATPRKP
ncbi:FAD-dependent thymidylate synthase [Camelimonas abortus]|uniref:FAD-dependent thymidylate synthase n=1 Tax=Camelimonas abortus TaxID=1017184 RepID=UPI0035E7D026